MSPLDISGSDLDARDAVVRVSRIRSNEWTIMPVMPVMPMDTKRLGKGLFRH